MKADRRVRVGS